MPDAASIEARIEQILATAFHLEIPSADLDLFETGAIDSLAFVEFLLYLEREFGLRVSLDDMELDDFRSIRRIARLVMASNGRAQTASQGEVRDSPQRAE